MSFFDDNKKIGLALWVIGILMILVAILRIYFGLTDDAVKADDRQTGWVTMGVCSLICALMFFGYGQNIRSGQIGDKFTIAAKLTFVIGMFTIIVGIFTAVSGFGFHEVTSFAVQGAAMIVLGLVVLFIYRTITGENAEAINKVIWIALMAIFILMLIASVANLFGINSGNTMNIITAVGTVGYIVVYLFVTVCMLDKDVRAKFGM